MSYKEINLWKNWYSPRNRLLKSLSKWQASSPASVNDNWQFYPKLLSPETPRLHLTRFSHPTTNLSINPVGASFKINLDSDHLSPTSAPSHQKLSPRLNPGMLNTAFPSFLVILLPLLSSLLTGLLLAFTTFQTSFHPAAKTTCKTYVSARHSSAQCPPMDSCHILGPSRQRPTGLDCQDLNLGITIRPCTRNPLMVQWLGLHASTARGTVSIPGRRTKTPHTSRYDPPKKASVQPQAGGVIFLHLSFLIYKTFLPPEHVMRIYSH